VPYSLTLNRDKSFKRRVMMTELWPKKQGFEHVVCIDLWQVTDIEWRTRNRKRSKLSDLTGETQLLENRITHPCELALLPTREIYQSDILFIS